MVVEVADGVMMSGTPLVGGLLLVVVQVVNQSF